MQSKRKKKLIKGIKATVCIEKSIVLKNSIASYWLEPILLKNLIQSKKMQTPDKPIVCLSLLWVCTSIFVRLVCVDTMFDDCTGNFHTFGDFFSNILVAGIYVTKTVKKYLQFVYIFADLMPVSQNF
jgi:hypothetical protein